MSFDLPTMLTVLVLTDLVMASALLAVAGQRRQVFPGLSVWGWGLVANALSHAAFALRFQGWWEVSFVLSNLLTSATVALHALALLQFQQGRLPSPPRWLIGLPVLATGLICLVFLYDDSWRVSLTTIVLCLQSFMLARLAWGPGLTQGREYGRLLLTLGAVLLVLMMTVRLTVLVAHQDMSYQLAVPVQLQAQTYLASLAIILLNTMGFVLMRNEHAMNLLSQQATHDPLTGASNRQALMEAFERTVSLAVRQNLSVAVLMIDIDYFKKINDNHGHQAGDEVLRELVSRILSRVRQQDLLARYGGEEFVVLLPGTNAEGALALAEKIRLAIASHGFSVQEQRLDITVSIGVCARVPEAAGTAVVAQMLAVADQAMYAAKQHGRNRVEVL